VLYDAWGRGVLLFVSMIVTMGNAVTTVGQPFLSVCPLPDNNNNKKQR